MRRAIQISMNKFEEWADSEASFSLNFHFHISYAISNIDFLWISAKINKKNNNIPSAQHENGHFWRNE